MIVEPKSKGFICTTAHPVGCAENIKEQIAYAKEEAKTYSFAGDFPMKKALVIGSSTGYGLASRIAATYITGCDTIGVMFEREASGKRTATAGYYNTRAFEAIAKEDGFYAESVNGDAFSAEIKEQVIAKIKEDFGKVDLVVYSLAAPKRALSDGTVVSSVLKTIGTPFETKSLNLTNNEIVQASLEPASDEEIQNTVSVMGGEDWKDWIDALKEADVLADNVMTMAYSYLGPELTYPIYQSGTIGRAKKHLQDTADELNQLYPGLKAYVSVNKAVVTQSSAAIPGVPLYLAALYQVMKEKGNHENCIMQMVRLFKERINAKEILTDEERRIRMDDWEMESDIQEAVSTIWNDVTTDNVKDLCDIDGYWEDFFKMFGFGLKNVDYSLDVEV